MGDKILIIGPSWVGDTIMSQALFKFLKRNNPNVIINVLAPKWTFSVLSRMPEVTSAIEMPIKHGELKLKERYEIAKRLRQEKYQQAIILPNSLKSALIPLLAGIPKRTGWLGEFRYLVLNDYRKLDENRYPLMIEQYLALGVPPYTPLTKPYPYPEFHITEEQQAAVLLKHKPIWRGRPILGVGAGAEFGPAKRWPEEYFAEVINKKLDEGWDVWLFGSQRDKTITDKIMTLTNNRCENIAGRSELAETIDLLSLTRAVITNDSGLMHIAAALKKPLIALYGSTSPIFTPPLSDNAIILKLDLDCQPCFQRSCPLEHFRCMKDLHPSAVIAATKNWNL